MRDNEETNLVTNFIEWYHQVFTDSELYKSMATTVESSPYHREKSVAVHTDMVVMNLLSALSRDVIAPKAMLCGLFAAAFHDTGKPVVVQVKNNEERGDYKSFAEHERASARLWESFYLKNRNFLLSVFGINNIDSYVIAVMIEWHRPWSLKDKEKIKNIHRSLLSRDNISVYHYLLWADNAGRISDDENNLESVKLKISRYREIANEISNFPIVDTVYDKISMVPETDFELALMMPIGVSGAGKSTFYDSHVASGNAKVHSMDLLRISFYGDDPQVAFKKSMEDSDFSAKVMKDFIQKIKLDQDLYIDNTNLSMKRRRKYLIEARRRKFVTVAYLFRISLDDVLKRQLKRGNKKVPSSSVAKQHAALTYPLIGEFDRIQILS